MNEMMIDIETLDVVNTAVVLQVGWVIFNGHRILAEKECNLDVPTQMINGRTISWSTLQFWMKQSDVARRSVMNDDYERWAISRVSHELVAQAQLHHVEKYWAKGMFDFDILDDLFKHEMPVPWSFRTKRDLRTALDFYPPAKDLERRDGPYSAHTGLSDAKHQWLQLLAIISKHT